MIFLLSFFPDSHTKTDSSNTHIIGIKNLLTEFFLPSLSKLLPLLLLQAPPVDELRGSVGNRPNFKGASAQCGVVPLAEGGEKGQHKGAWEGTARARN